MEPLNHPVSAALNLQSLAACKENVHFLTALLTDFNMQRAEFDLQCGSCGNLDSEGVQGASARNGNRGDQSGHGYFVCAESNWGCNIQPQMHKTISNSLLL